MGCTFNKGLMSMGKEDICGTCRYSEEDEGLMEIEKVECRWGPPDRHDSFPTPTRDQWCYQWAARFQEDQYGGL